MELMFVALGGLILGLAAHGLLPERALRGSWLLPAVGAASASALWVALTWARLPWNGGWIWVYTLVGAAVVSVAVGIIATRVRHGSDELRSTALAHGATAR